MRTNSAGFQQQIRAPSGEKRREKPKDIKSEHPEDPIYTSAQDLEPILQHPQPNWNQYTVTKISEGFDRINLEASRENEADHQSGANEYSATGRNTPLRQRSLPKPKVTSTLAPPKNHNNYGLKRKPITKEPAKKSDFTLLSQIEHGNFLATGANPGFQPPPKATKPSHPGQKYKTSDIQKKSSNSHRVHSDVASDFNDSRKRTRGQNQGIIIPKTRENPALPPRNVHEKKDGSSTFWQRPQLSRQKPVSRQNRRPMATDKQDSRQVPGSRSHTNQGNGSQSLVNSSYPSDRFSS
ncbi:hypothetical protein EAE99_010748 [Botrytis elliptica]|nr:hypothetical protein EAE99_010748 [Botrytis elliptica]